MLVGRPDRSNRTVLACAVAAVLALALCAAAARAQPAGQAIPVTVASVTRQDFPVYLSGIGSVQPMNTVLVRARVDGTLMKFVPTEGQEVKQGDLIAVIDPRPYQAALDQALAKRAQGEADVQNARQDLERYTTLAKQNYASRQQVDTQKALVDHLTAGMVGDEAAIETAKLNLSFCYITSPIGGRVGLRQVDPGNLIHATDATGIVTITQMRPIAVIFTLPQADLPRVTQAMGRGKLPVQAYAQDDRTLLDSGDLLTPDNAIDQATGTIKLKAVFPNAKEQLWPGQFVIAHLLIATERNVATIPSTAVQHGPEGLYAYVVGADHKVRRQPIEVSHDNGKVAVVARGLADAQIVVTDGQSRLQDGTPVAETNGSATAHAGG
jgi:multidrug efflux system membrane fusion protein